MTGHGLALPRTRTRRRKLPRPPKFTRGDKLWLLWETLIGTYFLIHFLAGDTPFAGLFGIAGATSGIRGTFLYALRRPESSVANMTSVALYLAAAAAFQLA